MHYCMAQWDRWKRAELTYLYPRMQVKSKLQFGRRPFLFDTVPITKPNLN